MEEVSNRTIAALLIVAMVISLSGTFLSLSKLNAVQSGSYTGFATNPNGTATLTLQNSTSIKFDVNLINWSTGYVNGSATGACNLTTGGPAGYANYIGGPQCVNFANPRPGPLVLENDGNLNVNVTLQANASATAWVGSGAYVYIQGSANESSSCNGTILGNTQFTTTPQVLCSNLSYVNVHDALDIDMLVSIPQNATPGTRKVQVEANATAV